MTKQEKRDELTVLRGAIQEKDDTIRLLEDGLAEQHEQFSRMEEDK